MAAQMVVGISTAAAPKFASVEDASRLVDGIDLLMVKNKLMDEDEGQGWSQEYTDYVERRYRRYLCMVYLSPDGSVVPTKDIDLFWHQHILDTRAYARDCQNLFGYFLHHFPYFGMRGEADAKNLLAAFEETKDLYARLFGEDYCAEDRSLDASKCHKCSGGPMKCHKCNSGPGPMQCHKCSS